MTGPFEIGAELAERLSEMTPEERTRLSIENVRRTEASYVRFVEAFRLGQCYLCKKPLVSFSKKTPCIHWLLKPKGFKKHDLLPVSQKFSLFQIQTYLRWIANQQGFAKNINDLQIEGSGTKLVELTIRYRNLEWSFSCGESDYFGHESSRHAKHPHYHFQMRVDMRPFINFNDFHLALMDRDIFSIEAKRKQPDIVKHSFPFGEGMSDVLNDNTVDILVKGSKGTVSEDSATFNLDSLVIADEGTTIKGKDVYSIIQEARAKDVSIASLLHTIPNVTTRVSVTPGPGVVIKHRVLGVGGLNASGTPALTRHCKRMRRAICFVNDIACRRTVAWQAVRRNTILPYT